jgi:hypothetical protein
MHVRVDRPTEDTVRLTCLFLFFKRETNQLHINESDTKL